MATDWAKIAEELREAARHWDKARELIPDGELLDQELLLEGTEVLTLAAEWAAEKAETK
jgi:hypothetical protein